MIKSIITKECQKLHASAKRQGITILDLKFFQSWIFKLTHT